MATRYFMCPTTGDIVDTRIDLDPASFASLPRDRSALSCLHCNKSHVLAGVSAWLGELERPRVTRSLAWRRWCCDGSRCR
jgi:hypothetical protein